MERWSTYCKISLVLSCKCPGAVSLIQSAHPSAVLPFLHPTRLCSSHYQFCSLTVILTLKAGRELKWFSLQSAFHNNAFLGVRLYNIISEIPHFTSEASSVNFSPEKWWRLKYCLLFCSTHFKCALLLAVQFRLSCCWICDSWLKAL